MPPTNDQASLDLARQIDQMCDRFEALWAAGDRPRAEDFVARQPVHLRGRLLLALLPLELELLAREGKSPSQADCRRRFPGLESVVGKVFASRQQKPASRVSVRSPQVPAPQAEPVAKTIGRFQVKKVLGEGAFGTVYLAHDPRLDRDVAIKVPKHNSLGESFDTNRFLREAKTAASLRHANICPVYEAGVEDGRPYIVTAADASPRRLDAAPDAGRRPGPLADQHRRFGRVDPVHRRGAASERKKRRPAPLQSPGLRHPRTDEIPEREQPVRLRPPLPQRRV
jgi:hypothetical protein